MRGYSKIEIIKKAWSHVAKNLRFFALSTIMIAFVGWFPDFVVSKVAEDNIILRLTVIIVTVAISSLISIGFLRVVLNAVDRKHLKFSDIFNNYRLILKYLTAEAISGIFVSAGLLFFIVPGIILSVRLQFTEYFIVDEGIGPIDALKKSWKITKGATWELFLFILLLILINVAGALALGVGLLLSYPTSLIAQAYVFRKLKKNASELVIET